MSELSEIETDFSDSEDLFDSSSEEETGPGGLTGTGLGEAAGTGMGMAGGALGARGALGSKPAKPKWSLFSKLKGKKQASAKPKATVKKGAAPAVAPPRPTRAAPALPPSRAKALANSAQVKIDPGQFDVSARSEDPIYRPADPPGGGGGDPIYKDANSPADEEPIYGAGEPASAVAAANPDDIEISEDEVPGPFVPQNKAEAKHAFEGRKRRRDDGHDGSKFDAAKGYTPRKLDDTKYWGEHEAYFRADNDASGVPARTKYYDDAERAQHQVGVKDGLLTGADGALLATTSAKAPMAMAAQAGRHIFAMSQNDELYSADAIAENEASAKKATDWHEGGGRGPAPANRDMTHHSSFLEGKAIDDFGFYDSNKAEGVKGAGELAVKEGWLQKISNVSGHYLPDMKNTTATVQALEAKGVNTDATKVENMVKESNGALTTTEYMARAVAATGGDTKLMDTHKKAFDKINRGKFALNPTPAPSEAPAEAWWKSAYRAGETD